MRTVLLVLAVPFCCFSQPTSTATLTGTITDPSQAVITGATVTATNTETDTVRRGQSDNTGNYRFDFLPPGPYRVAVEYKGFAPSATSVTLTVGANQRLDVPLALSASDTVQVVSADGVEVEAERSHQGNLIDQRAVQELPIDRRDYLTFSLLAPGVSDSKALADANTFRVKQTPDSGLSFYGSNGRGNVVNVDGAESNDGGGGVRPTVGQDAVREFQVDRSNYSAEYGGSRGGVVNIVTKSGTNTLHGGGFALFRNQILDATNPFSVVLHPDNTLQRVKPDSSRQQFGVSLGGPLQRNRTFYFLDYEQLRRRETTAVPILTDLSVFGPTPAQRAVLSQLPAAGAAPLTTALSTPPAIQKMFEMNSGIFPFQTDQYQGLIRLDRAWNENNQTSLRLNSSQIAETNPNLTALTGYSRGYVQSFFDATGAASWIHAFFPRVINEARVQFNYDNPFTGSNDPYGPALEIAGYGNFNRDRFLPSNEILRRTEMLDNLTINLGRHTLKTGAYVLIRNDYVDSATFMSGRFTFGPLPGSLVSPVLASTTLTALQAFNLGLAQSYQQGFGNGVVKATTPLSAGYVQDEWRPVPSLTIDAGVRYEVDARHMPLPTSYSNLAPRIGFAWSPGKRTVIRGGYGIYFAAIDFQIDYSVDALGIRPEGSRPIAQVLTTIQNADPRQSAAAIFKTLQTQGVIGIPTPMRSVQASDLSQFGIAVSQTGPLPPLSVIFSAASGYKNPETQQASLGIERQTAGGVNISVSGIFVRGEHLTNAYDNNLLPSAPFDPAIGTRNYGPSATHPFGYFVNPLVYQSNVYTSESNSFYGGLLLEASKRAGRHLELRANYTLSHATDETTDYNSDFEPNDIWCRRCDRASSSFDERHKVVVYTIFDSPARDSRFLRGWSLAPIYQYHSGRPFNLLAGGADLNNDRHNTTDRPAYSGRNTGLGPSFWAFDARLQRSFGLTEKLRLNFTLEAFNLFNKLNYASVNNIVGLYAGPFHVTGRDDRRPTDPLGYTSAFEPRRLQLGLRLTF